jgi:DNA-binding response OmpR family regulator
MVLIADDDELLGALLCHQLGLQGVAATHTRDGREVLALVTHVQPSAVVLDLMLSGIDGFDVLREIKENPATAATPVLILSPRTMARDVDTALGLGANAYISKPFVPKDLIDKLVALDRGGKVVDAPHVRP